MTHAPPLQLWGICLCWFVSGLELALPVRDRAKLQVSVLVFGQSGFAQGQNCQTVAARQG